MSTAPNAGNNHDHHTHHTENSQSKKDGQAAKFKVVRPQESVFLWDEDLPPAANYEALGERLAACDDLFRNPLHGEGLRLILPDGKSKLITKGADLAPVIVDRVPLLVVRDGKTKASMVPAAHLNAMLQAEKFLGQFWHLDSITSVPMYLPDFTLTRPGYNDGGMGHRILYQGERPQVSNSLSTINQFLDVMDWDSNADRTNAVAAALTVMLRNHWAGGKPVIVATATKSHAGKDTVITFAAGLAGSVSISYQATNWALQRDFVGAVKTSPDDGVVVAENARLDRRDRCIASAFLERFATDPQPLLFSTGTGAPVRRRNDLVLAISTNFGTVSEDLMNRALPIHLSPVGDVASRKPSIGNPRHEFLPANKEQIAAELRGMIARWIAAGQPDDLDARHPFGPWAKVVGGILRVSGFTDFLGNYGQRKTTDDPVRRGLGLLGAAHHDEWLGAAAWAKSAVDLGLTKAVIPEAERENEISRTRGIGKVLSAHDQEAFLVETDALRLTLRLEKARRRRDGSEPQVRYCFVKVGSQPLPVDGDQSP
ncbi:MAG: hypothetical protein GXY83_34175 [Rhodopirellula sp.]|nr:hypothetical protein [Rhodopirellula sp.]